MTSSKKQFIIIILLTILFLLPVKSFADNSNTLEVKYELPPKEMMDIADAPLTPGVTISPDNKWMLLKEYPYLTTIKELAKPELPLAGLRIDPANFGPSRESSYNKIAIRKIDDGSEIEIKGLPKVYEMNYLKWSPDSNYIAFTMKYDDRIDLWIIDIKTGMAEKLSELKVNDVYGTAFWWKGDSKSIICKTVPENYLPPPEKENTPEGPVIQETSGKIAPARTYQNLLENPYDELLFEYYLTSQIVNINLDGKTEKIGSPNLIKTAKPSPDGNYILVETIKRPFSYVVPLWRFPLSIEIWDKEGNIIREIADLPLAEEIPLSFDAVRKGPRYVDWRDDVSSTLYWVEALDEGDPEVEAEYRDCLYELPAPFTAPPVPLIYLTSRLNDIVWGNDNLALVWEYWRKTRTIKIWKITPGSPEKEAVKLFEYSKEDQYNHPGRPETKKNKWGKPVIITREDKMYLSGSGASPEGNRPFIDEFNLTTGEITRLWRSEPPYYEQTKLLIAGEELLQISRRESITEPPNYFLRNLNTGEIKELTKFPHPHPQFKDIQKELIKYTRKDGVELTATLYLPPDYSPEEGPLPAIIWAYPREFKSADAAGQVTTSPYRFIRIYWFSPLIYLTQGYAVLDKASMPIIGEGDEEPNDTYIEQLVLNAEAAVDELVKRGVADKERIAIGGTSYGAFMTANLLAHTDLFAAGLARSGAYNRTLTPFGFQGEERSFWEAPEVYFNMSPFMHADKINEPILLIHGREDNNTGTYPMQSERLYEALKGLGGNARLVMLPCESHHYKARESVFHVLWETNRWLEEYVKNKKM